MFNSEKELVETIILSADKFLGQVTSWERSEQNYVGILEEINLGHGIPDIVLTKHPPSQICCRSRQLKYTDLLIYRVISCYKKGILQEQLKNISGLPNSSLTGIISSLIRENLISEKNNRFFCQFKPPEEVEVLAIEAKIQNWKRALKQAYRYKWFATYSYVFLDEKYANSALKNKSLFKTYNVGLASVSITGSVEILVKPQRIKPYDKTMLSLLGEHLLFGQQKRLPRA